MIFVRSWNYRAYDTDIFAELTDNVPSGCRQVVGFDSRKWGYFGGICTQSSAL